MNWHVCSISFFSKRYLFSELSALSEDIGSEIIIYSSISSGEVAHEGDED